jgi:hypothetical protein
VGRLLSAFIKLGLCGFSLAFVQFGQQPIDSNFQARERSVGILQLPFPGHHLQGACSIERLVRSDIPD